MTAEDRARKAVTPELIEAFARDGALCLRQLLSPAEVQRLREGIDANLAAPSPRAKVASRPDDPGFFIEDFCCWQDNPAYRDVVAFAVLILVLVVRPTGLLGESVPQANKV